MKLCLAATISFLFNSALAVTIKDLPACSVSCLTTAVATDHCPSSLPYTPCHCINGQARDALLFSINSCLYKNCDLDEVVNALGISNEICDEVQSSFYHQEIRRDPHFLEERQTRTISGDSSPESSSPPPEPSTSTTPKTRTSSTLEPSTASPTFSSLLSSTPSPAGHTTASPTFSSLPSLTPSPAEHTTTKSGISTGAKAGVAIGVILALLIVAVIAFLVLKKRRQSKKLTAEGFIADDPGYQAPEMVLASQMGGEYDQPVLTRKK